MTENGITQEYAPPFDGDAYLKEYHNCTRFNKYFNLVAVLLFLLIAFVVGYQSYQQLNSPFWIVIILITILFVSLSLIKLLNWVTKSFDEIPNKTIQNNGWINIFDILGNFLYKTGLVMVCWGIISLTIVIIISFPEHYFMSILFLGWGLIKLTMYKLFPQQYGRNFEYSFDNTRSLLESNTNLLQLNGPWRTNLLGWRIISNNGVKITIIKGKKQHEGKTGVTISTSLSKIEDNNRLRELVTSILEGKVLPASQ